MTHRLSSTFRLSIASLPLLLFAACARSGTGMSAARSMPVVPGSAEQVALGRYLVISHDCGGCHGGGSDPGAPGWLDGQRTPDQIFQIGPFKTYPRNLTPDNATGLGRFSERQIFNALRFGLRPGETPDVEITSTVPGQGTFP